MNKERILGAIYGVAVGDAMGAATELRSRKQIIEKFNGYVYNYLAAPGDTFARDYPAGTVTDDFSMSYYIMKAICENNGVFNEEIAESAIVAWGEDEVYFDKFAGPTTRLAIERIQAGLPHGVDPYGLVNFNSQATNGGAMKTMPLALLAKGDLEKAVQYTLAMCRPTHYNSTAVAAAAAICCATVVAQQADATLSKIYEAAIWGAKRGRELMEAKERISVAPDIAWKIEHAVELGAAAKGFDDLLTIVDTKVGTNIQVSESIPAVFAIISGVNGDLMQGIYAAVNVGGDTDTIAAMLGGILGGLHGVAAIPEQLITTMLAANPNLEIEKTVTAFTELLLK